MKKAAAERTLKQGDPRAALEIYRECSGELQRQLDIMHVAVTLPRKNVTEMLRELSKV